jgi:D-cysteine desulfhydrase family pyridoxal phosphate-dependent enzyme
MAEEDLLAPAAAWPAPPPRLRLAHLPTPIEALTPAGPGIAAAARANPAIGIGSWAGAAIDIKRDDLTGCLLSGNKIRKLEFILADARRRGASCVITCGGTQSNHARATAGASARLGLGCVLLLRRPAAVDAAASAGACTNAGINADARVMASADGNLFLDDLLGARVRWVSAAEYEDRDRAMAAVADELRARGETPYVIPEGASNALGAWGYVHMMEELREQVPAFPWRVIVCAIGSGGTHAGLLLGARRLGLDVRIRSYCVQRTPDYFRGQVLSICEAFAREFGAPVAVRGEEVEIVSGFEGPAYAEVYPEEVAAIRGLARGAGILLDPVYTGKAFTGLLADLRAGRIARDEHVLFVHTGGIFGLMAQRRDLL